MARALLTAQHLTNLENFATVLETTNKLPTKGVYRKYVNDVGDYAYCAIGIYVDTLVDGLQARWVTTTGLAEFILPSDEEGCEGWRGTRDSLTLLHNSLGMRFHTFSTLMTMNDRLGYSFSDIASEIRHYKEHGVFSDAVIAILHSK